nr:hypothetical protein [uncultured Tolumonas sp.]
MKKYLIGIIVVSLNVSSAEIYQCGNSFQDHPCAVGAPAKVIGNFEPEKLSPKQEKLKKKESELAAAQIESDIQARYDAEVLAAKKARAATYQYARTIDAVHNKQIIVGMTKGDLVKSWGNPDHINESVTGSDMRQQWVYITSNGRQYVYVRDGIVTGWN